MDPIGIMRPSTLHLNSLYAPIFKNNSHRICICNNHCVYSTIALLNALLIRVQ